MNFDDTPAEAQFRLSARAWIEKNAPHHLRPILSSIGFLPQTDEQELLILSREWQHKKQTAGWACLDWPKEFGGQGASPMERVIWDQEEGPFSRLGAVFVVGQGMCAPTLMKYGSEEHKRRHLPRIASGEEIWCQLFSEPSGGSDLAALRTRAEWDGDRWIVNGQKIWTSHANHADYGILLTRTDPTVPKHAGLTMLFVDMKSAGVEVRPIRQANGQSEFNEVFFTDVAIADDYRLGAVNGGWQVALTTLMNERLTVGHVLPTAVPEMIEFCHGFELDGKPAICDPAVREHLADWIARAEGLRCTGLRTVSAISQGLDPGPENSIGKLVVGQLLQEISAYAINLQGQRGMIADGFFQSVLLRAPATRIEGGTDEVLRNIIAERVLGLPPEFRPDKGVPFNELR